MCNTSHHSHWGGRHRGSYHKQHAQRWMNQMFANAWGYPPVNVEELDNHYEIRLYAAGYAKSDFKVNLKDGILTVAVENAETDRADRTNWDPQKFMPGGFERRFKLNDKIDKESITAKYEGGVLTLTLQKLPGFETSRQDIEVN